MKKHKPSSQAAVLAYSEAHVEEASYLTARELGERCNVSESTVIRAVQSMGYSGFPEYQAAIRKNFARQRTTVERFAAAHGTDPLAGTFSRDVENIRSTWEQLSPEGFGRAVDILCDAPRIRVLGLRMAHSVAVILGYGLSMLGADAGLLTRGHGSFWDELDNLAAGDALVVITLPRYTRTVVDAAAAAHAKGVRVIAVTDNHSAPLAPISEVLLPVACNLDGYIESFTASICLAQALLMAVAEKWDVKGLAALKAKEALWAKRGVYWEPET